MSHKDSKSIELASEVIEQKIFLVRGQKVMLNVHLALLYGVETRVLMQAVKRNQVRFPDDFVFALDRQEIKRISQFVTSLKYSKSVYVFTEQGIAMLSSVLHSPRAIQVNIQIMRTFTKLREIMISHKDLARKIDDLERKYDRQFGGVFEAIKQLLKKKREVCIIPTDDYKRTKIGFIVDDHKR